MQKTLHASADYRKNRKEDQREGGREGKRDGGRKGRRKTISTYGSALR